MERHKALVVGIDYYRHVDSLFGCTNDARGVEQILEEHHDGQPNFAIASLRATSSRSAVTKERLRAAVKDLFDYDGDIALFYFAGHGHIESTGGYLLTSECKSGHDGLPLAEVVKFANDSEARNRIIVLDSCHSGVTGSVQSDVKMSELKEGMTILTASTAKQYASEVNNSGVFTTLFINALSGPAANLLGDVTPGSIYAHIDQSLGPWERQRPVFKTNVKDFVSLRRSAPPIELKQLQRITELFKQPDEQFRLDPSFEPRDEGRTPSMPRANPKNTEKFAVLQKYNRVNLVVPVGAPHMWNAAMEYKACALTPLGQHYWRLRRKKHF